VTLPAELEGLSSAQIAASSPLALARFCMIPTGIVQAGSTIVDVEPRPLVPWPHQRDLWQKALEHRRIVVLKARQLGVTWTWAVLALWYAVSHPATQTVIVSIGEREALSVMRRIRQLHAGLPVPLKQAFQVARQTTEMMELAHPEGNAIIWSLPSSGTAGRGETVNLLVMDEGAHWEDSSSRVASLIPAQADIGQVVLSSTANGIGGTFFDTWDNALDLDWEPVFLGALARPDRTMDWVMKQRRMLDLRGQDEGRLGLGAQEYPLTPAEAFISSGYCIFPADVLADYLTNSVTEHIWRGTLLMDATGVTTRTAEGGSWRVWRWREADRKYLISGDPCGGGGGLDSAAMVVLDTLSLDQVASFYGKPDPEEFARQMYRAGWLWQDGAGHAALLCPEANDYGRAVLAYLREWKYPNLWHSRRFDQRRAEETVQYGWHTSAASRPVMIAALQEGLRLGQLGVRDRYAIAEMQRFIANPQKGDRPEAMEGYHDDRVMAWAIAAVVSQREAAGVQSTPVDPSILQPYRRAESELGGY